MLYGALEPRPQSMQAFFFLRDRQALDGVPAEVRLAHFEEGTFASKALLADPEAPHSDQRSPSEILRRGKVAGWRLLEPGRGPVGRP